MTAGVAGARAPRAGPAPDALAAVTLVAGCVALLARPISDAYIWLTIAVGFAGALHPADVARLARRTVVAWAATVTLGVSAFAVARGLLGESLMPPVTGWLMLAAIAAAVAEELFFRRFVYGALSRWGPGVALAVSSFTFAIVHVTEWGWQAFPIDLAAGVLLGWQRWVTGSWTASAVTHVVANVMILW